MLKAALPACDRVPGPPLGPVKPDSVSVILNGPRVPVGMVLEKKLQPRVATPSVPGKLLLPLRLENW
jgi:hypothetical protein